MWLNISFILLFRHTLRTNEKGETEKKTIHWQGKQHLTTVARLPKTFKKARVIFRLARSKITNVTERADMGNW